MNWKTDARDSPRMHLRKREVQRSPNVKEQLRAMQAWLGSSGQRRGAQGGESRRKRGEVIFEQTPRMSQD